MTTYKIDQRIIRGFQRLFYWGFMVLLVASCSNEEPDAAKTKSTVGVWKQNDESLGWIPTFVHNPDGSRNRGKEARIRENLENPSFERLRAQNLFNTNLFDVPMEKKPWSSGFFPSWFDGVAGRWSRNAVRELMGYKLNSEGVTFSYLFGAITGSKQREQSIYRLSPMEKYDLVSGDYSYGATRRELAMRGHKKMFMALWAGYCNGVSAAAIQLKEPFRRVDVINPDGYKISFHPYDIKALLGVAYYKVDYENYARLGSRCRKDIELSGDRFDNVTGGGNDDGGVSFRRVDDRVCRGVNPATFVLALQNRLGIANESFVIDKVQGREVSNHPIGDARIDIMKGPYKLESEAYGVYAAPNTTHLVDVKISVWLGSTTLSDKEAVNRLLDRKSGLYKKVGFQEDDEDSPRVYYATLELDKWGQMVGGEWGIMSRYGSYDKATNAPDFAWFGVKPMLVDEKQLIDTFRLGGKALKAAMKHNERVRCVSERGDHCDSTLANPKVKWSVVKAIYEKSILSEIQSPEIPVVHLTQSGVLKKRPPLNWEDPQTGMKASLNVASAFHKGNLIHVAGSISGQGYFYNAGGQSEAWKADLVRLYSYEGSDKLTSDSLISHLDEMKPLGDDLIQGVDNRLLDGQTHFRLRITNKRPAKLAGAQYVLMLYRLDSAAPRNHLTAGATPTGAFLISM